MNQSCAAFIEKLSHIWTPLAAIHQDTLAYWKPDEPPTTAAYAELGRKIADDLDMFSPAVRAEIMSVIEEGMTSGDEDLEIAVATGLIEAMIGRANRSEGSIDRILRYFGAKSRSHAEAWMGW